MFNGATTDRVLFHATSVKNADEIIAEGIKVSTVQTLDPVNFAWFATNRNRALSYLRTWNGEERGVIFSVQFPAEHPDAQVGGWDCSDDQGFAHNIPVEWIVDVEVIG